MKKLTITLLNIFFTLTLIASVIAMIFSAYAGMEGSWTETHTILACCGVPIAALSTAALNYIDRQLPI